MEVQELIDILTAFKAGKTIEYRSLHHVVGGKPEFCKEWIKFKDKLSGIGNLVNLGCPMRVKPESKCRPYKNADEFFKASKEHGEWFELKSDPGYKFKPIGCGPEYIRYHHVVLNTSDTFYYKAAVENFVWSDDKSPLGVLEE